MLVRFVAARASLQEAELEERQRDVGAAVKSRRQAARRRQAACEWLVPEVHAAATASARSQLDALRNQVLCRA